MNKNKGKNQGKNKTAAKPAESKTLDQITPAKVDEKAEETTKGQTDETATDETATDQTDEGEGEDGEETDEEGTPTGAEPATEGAAPAEGEKKKKSRKAMNLIKDPVTGENFKLLGGTIDTIKRYAIAFLNTAIPYSGGYKKYVGNGGYSNSDFPKEMNAEGHAKVVAVSLTILGKRAGEGDEEAREVLSQLGAMAATAADEAGETASTGHLIALAKSGMDVMGMVVNLPEHIKAVLLPQIEAINASKKKPAKAAAK